MIEDSKVKNWDNIQPVLATEVMKTMDEAIKERWQSLFPTITYVMPQEIYYSLTEAERKCLGIFTPLDNPP